jgi:superfamily II DNA or RNA helicase
MTRDEIQSRAVHLISLHDRLLLSWATGVGKTLGFIKIQEFLNAQETWIVVAEVAHIKNWEDEYKKHGKEHLLNKTRIFCYASLKNNLNAKIDLLCLDEGHHATSELRLDHLSSISSTKIVALTATLSQEKRWSLEGLFGRFNLFSITLKQAIAWGIIPEPKVFIIPLELNKVDKNCRLEQSWGKKKERVEIECDYLDRWNYIKFKDKYPNVTLTLRCTEWQKNFYYNEQSEYWRKMYMRSRQEFQKVKWLLTGAERKRFLGNIKSEKVKPFIEKLSTKRYICFCTSIEQAEYLGGNNAIHSKMDEGTPVESIEAFNNGVIDNLFVVGMLQEGQNLNNIEAGIIIQLDNEDRPFVQKSGRALRAKEPILLVFYYKDTRDEEYLAKILEGIEPEYVRIVTNVNEIEL